MTYEVVSDIKMPKRTRNRYPFRDMAVGDSFFVPATDVKSINNIRAAASHFSSRTGFGRYSVLKDGDGWRVFRTA